MDRGWRRLERIVLSRFISATLHIWSWKRRLGIDEGISGSILAEHDNCPKWPRDLSAYGPAGTLRCRDYVER